MAKPHEFIRSHQISYEDIRENFTLEREYEKNLELNPNKHCLNCDDSMNANYFPAEAWTSVQYCVKCNKINLITHSDRMGGNHMDTIFIYGETDD